MSDTQGSKEKEWKGSENAVSQAFGEEPDPSVMHRMSDEIYVGQKYRSFAEEKKEKKDSIARDISILVIITLVAGCLLGAAYGVTKDPIAAAQAEAKAKAQREVIKDADHFETLYTLDNSVSGDENLIPGAVAEAIRTTGFATTSVTQIDGAYDADGKPVGYVISVNDPDGYGGDVGLMCGITPNSDGSVILQGISFLTLSETAGMGMRAKDEEFLSQFSGKQLQEGELILYTKAGASRENEIDAISGCTMTTSAVTDDVNAALLAAWELMRAEREAAE